MTLKRFFVRGFRFVVGMVTAPALTLDKLQQYRMIDRGKRTFAANGLEVRFRALMSDAFQPKYHDLIRLWDIVREDHPSFILEYGSGCSTLVMAAALALNRKEGKAEGKLMSIEGYEKWRDHTYSHLTEEEKQFVEVRVLQPEVVSRALKINNNGNVIWYRIQKGADVEQGIVGLVYPELHDLSPDMIYLDGPDPNSVEGYTDSTGVTIPAVVFDPLDMEHHLPLGTTVVVDGRPTNTIVLSNNFRKGWAADILPHQKCTILRRR